MSNIYLETTDHEQNLLVLALNILLNNRQLAFDTIDCIFISNHIPSIIQKLSDKTALTNVDFYIVSVALEYIHGALDNLTPIANADRNKLLPHRSAYEQLYKKYCFTNSV